MRLSLRHKLIGATVLLLVFVVALFGIAQGRLTRADLGREAERLRELRLEQAESLGRGTVGALASGASLAIAENDYASLQAQLGPLVQAPNALPVTEALVCNDAGEVLAYAAKDEGRPIPKQVPLDDLKALKGPKVALVRDERQDPREVVVSAPIEDRNGKRWGYARFTYDLGALREELAKIEAEADARRAEVVRRTVLLGGLIVLLGVMVAVLQSIAITRSLVGLARSARALAGGDLSTRAKEGGGDEIGDLARDFNHMAARVEALLVETASKTALERELEVARLIQEAILPPKSAVEAPGLRVCGVFRPASVCGGDFWACDDWGQGRTLLSVGDVTGHGVPSAMITAACRSGLDTLRAVTQGRVSVDALMSQLNHTIHKAGRRKFTMTFVGLLYEPRTGEAMLASAGHPFPLLARRQGARVELRPLVARGSRLGDQPESEYVPVREVLQVGDLLCLFSDGLTEARSPQGVFFGERRLGRLLQQHFDLSPEAALEKIVAEWAAFVGAQPQEDDLTLVLARVER